MKITFCISGFVLVIVLAVGSNNIQAAIGWFCALAYFLSYESAKKRLVLLEGTHKTGKPLVSDPAFGHGK